MTEHNIKTRTAALLIFGCVVLCASTTAQTASETSAAQSTAQPTTSQTIDKPIPDIVSLMHDVQANQRKSEAVEKDYIYHSVRTEREFDSHGQVKKTTITELDHFWLNGVPVRRVVKKDGKALSPEELAKENERIDKISANAREKRDKADDKGKATDSRGNEEVTVSRLLELGSFTNARRVQLDGRDAIAVDFA